MAVTVAKPDKHAKCICCGSDKMTFVSSSSFKILE